MNPTITSAARLVLILVGALTALTLLVTAALVAFRDVEVEQTALLAALIVNGPIMAMIALLANTRPNTEMLAAMQQRGSSAAHPDPGSDLH